MSIVTKLRSLVVSDSVASVFLKTGVAGYVLTVVAILLQREMEAAVLAVVSTDFFVSGHLLRAVQKLRFPQPVYTTVFASPPEASDEDEEEEEGEDEEEEDADEEDADEDSDEAESDSDESRVSDKSSVN